MTHPYTKLADALELKGQSWQELKDREEACREAARILRAAAAVDVAGLMAMVRRYGDDNWMGNDDTNKLLPEIESALRMALAARETHPSPSPTTEAEQ